MHTDTYITTDTQLYLYCIKREFGIESLQNWIPALILLLLHCGTLGPSLLQAGSSSCELAH